MDFIHFTYRRRRQWQFVRFHARTHASQLAHQSIDFLFSTWKYLFYR